MALPDSRNTTYAAGDPVKAADLNDFQDNIVGDKHPTRTLHLGAADFTLKGSSGATLADGQWTFTALATIVCGLGKSIPEGHVITSITWRYNRGGSGTVTRRLRVREMATPAAAADVAGFPVADNTGAAHENNTDTPNYTVAANTGPWLEVTGDAAANVFVGATVNYRKG